MSGASGAIYRFDRFVLDLGRGALFEQGIERQLRPKSFSLLQYFLGNAGRVIGHDEIMQAVWPDVLVTDASVATSSSAPSMPPSRHQPRLFRRRRSWQLFLRRRLVLLNPPTRSTKWGLSGVKRQLRRASSFLGRNPV
jgi:hypothetical protein